LAVTLLTLSCGKEDEPKRDEFPMKFTVYNKGDNHLYQIKLDTYTFYPYNKGEYGDLLNTTIAKTNSYLTFGTDNYLFSNDSIVITPRNYIFFGCRYTCIVSIIKNNTTFDLYKYSSSERTIEKKEDAKTVITWPDDSLLFTKIIM
jgi:hypothetical protein